MPGGLDHIVPVARDLDKLSEFYRGLGFKVGARNRHDWGTLNHIVQFDGCFLELLTTEPGFQRPSVDQPISQFTEPVADYLEKHDGIAMCVLEAFDASADQEQFALLGIAGPSTFHFQRKGKSPDGSDVDVAFSLAFARMPGFANGGFFVCEQHNPEAFWSSEFQNHPNRVRGIAGVSFIANDVGQAANFFTRYSGRSAVPAEGRGHVRINTARGWIDVLSPDAAVAKYGGDMLPSPPLNDGFVALHFLCDDIDAVAKFADTSGTPSTNKNDHLMIPAAAAFGATLVFEPAE